jgi:hypothetical protein
MLLEGIISSFIIFTNTRHIYARIDSTKIETDEDIGLNDKSIR